MKSNQQVEPIIADDFSSVRWEIKGLAPLSMDMTKLSDAVKRRASCVGMAQVRIVDAAAISRTDKAGAIRSAEEMLRLKREKMADLIAWYETGTEEWSRVSATGEKGGYLFEALCRVFPNKSREEVREFYEALSDKEAAALREDDEVAPHIAAIKKERQGDAPKVDTAGLLSKLKP